MKKLNGKFLSVLFLCTIFIVSAFGPQLSFAADESAGQQEAVYVTKSNMEYELAQVGIVAVDSAAKNLGESEIYADDYGGIYVGSDGNLILLLTEGSRSLKSIVGNPNNKIKVETVKFSEKELFSVLDYCINHCSELNIVSWGTRISYNKVKIGILRDGNSGALEKEIRAAIVRDCAVRNKNVEDMLLFDYLEFVPRLLATVSGGSAVNNASQATSVGYPVGSGFITCGHGYSDKQKVRISDNANGTIIGTVRMVKFNGGSDDSAYVEFDTGHGFSDTIPYVPSVSHPAQWGAVYQKGYKSGTKSSVIVDVNAGYTGNGYTWTDMLETSVAMQGGDSGGPIYLDQYYGTTLSRMVYGIAHGVVSSSTTYYVKQKNIKAY